MNIDAGIAIVSDINFFVGLNFTNTQNLRIKLYSPDGDSDEVCMNNTQMGQNNNVVTIFDDNADSILLNGRYVSFGPAVKHLNGLNSRFNGIYVTEHGESGFTTQTRRPIRVNFTAGDFSLKL